MPRPAPPKRLAPIRTTISLPTWLHEIVEAELARRHNEGIRATYSAIVEEALIAYREIHFPTIIAAEEKGHYGVKKKPEEPRRAERPATG